MEVHLDWDEPPMGRDKPKQKRGRPQGRRASSPAEVADQTGRVLAEREPEWLERLTTDPASFAAVEREVHEQARRQADLYVAGLLAKAGESPEMTQHVDRVRAAAEVPLRPPGKKKRPLVVRLLGGLAITVMTLYCSPRVRTGKRRGREGSGLYPELAAYRISEGSSPNVQAEVGRLVAQLPIEQARAELTGRGLELDEKAVGRIAHELGAQMLATRTRDLTLFRRGELPPGSEFAGKRIAVGMDGGRVRVRTAVETIRVGGKPKRKKFPDRHGFWGGRRLRRFPQGAEVSVSKSEPLVAEQVERADFSSADICSAKPPAVPEAVKRHRKPPEGRVLQGFHEPPPKSVTVRKKGKPHENDRTRHESDHEEHLPGRHVDLSLPHPGRTSIHQCIVTTSADHA